MNFNLSDAKICVVGMGYVGLPLAVEFAKFFPTIGYDINTSRIRALESGFDETQELSTQDLADLPLLSFSSSPSDLESSNVYIVTVPTPIDDNRQPDLTPLKSASCLLGEVISSNNLVVFESTVFPGATEEICIPIIEKISGLKLNKDFYAGYSPERINPGDKARRLTSIIKVTSGSNESAAEIVNKLYLKIIQAGTYKAISIKVAEAAKVIENTQRDLNIALINELAIIFNKMNIDTQAVLDAAATKWNFLPFKPGLVGGHCIGVDPYYLTYKAQSVGYTPEVILAGRRLNDDMGRYVAAQLVKALIRKRFQVCGARVLIMGLTFKENCPDLRNTKVFDVIDELMEFGVGVEVYDPWVKSDVDIGRESVRVHDALPQGLYDGVILAVAHDDFCNITSETLDSILQAGGVLYDLKGIAPRDRVDISL